jgi:hypothetical protein
VPIDYYVESARDQDALRMAAMRGSPDARGSQPGDGYDRLMPHAAPLVDEIANELDTWPGVHTERRAEGLAVIRYEHLELGVLDRDRGVAVLRFSRPVHDELIDRGAEPADSAPDSDRVLHGIAGPADVTAVLELFDRRYRDLRGEDAPYSSEDPA